jgi:energy-coupling factor transport system ATP-binding protein
MISHDMELVARYTERTLVVGKGQLLLDSPTREVFDHISLLRGTFIEPPEIIRLAQELQACGLQSGLLSIDQVTEGIRKLKKSNAAAEG